MFSKSSVENLFSVFTSPGAHLASGRVEGKDRLHVGWGVRLSTPAHPGLLSFPREGCRALQWSRRSEMKEGRGVGRDGEELISFSPPTNIRNPRPGRPPNPGGVPEARNSCWVLCLCQCSQINRPSETQLGRFLLLVDFRNGQEEANIQVVDC